MFTRPHRLQLWANKNKPDDSLIYKNGYWSQIVFVRDELARLMNTGRDWWLTGDITSVISTHTSKSVRLPVFQLERKDLGLTIILRYNFHDWKMSVISEKPIKANFAGLFYTSGGGYMSPCYFEGFPSSRVFGSYDSSDGRKWSAEIHGDSLLFTVIYLILQSLGAMKPLEYITGEAFTKQLKEQTAREKEYERKVGAEAVVLFWALNGKAFPNEVALEEWDAMPYSEKAKLIEAYEKHEEEQV